MSLIYYTSKNLLKNHTNMTCYIVGVHATKLKRKTRGQQKTKFRVMFIHLRGENKIKAGTHF